MDITSSFNSLSVANLPPILDCFAAKINGNHTEFVITNFPGYVNIIITQYGKIGNLYQVKIDQPENGFSIAEPVYSISTLLGGENLEAEVAVRYLAEKLKIRRTLLLCLSLKEFSRNTLNAVIDTIERHRTS